MIKNKSKKIISLAMLLIIMSTIFSTNVYAAIQRPTARPSIITIKAISHFNKETGELVFSRGERRSSFSRVKVTECVWKKKYKNEIKSVKIEEGINLIDERTFLGCTSLQEITIPASVTTIGAGAFLGCKSLTSITIPDSVTEIGFSAFDGCTSLKEITIPDSVTEIGFSAFDGCTDLTSINVDESNPNYRSIDGVLFSKDETRLIRYPIRKDGDNYTIPASVTTIDNFAFCDCESLKEVTIPSSVTTIGNHAFNGCTSLKEITIPSSVTTIGEWAFYSCTSLTADLYEEEFEEMEEKSSEDSSDKE